MTDEEKILPFCSVDKTRPALHKPFVSDGYLYATDGRAVIRFKTDRKEAPPEENKRFPHSVGKIYRDNIAEFTRCGGPVWMELPKLKDVPAIKIAICPNCAGNGRYFEKDPDGEKVSCECEECEGDGEVDETPLVRQEISCQSPGAKAAQFDVRLLHKVASLGPVSVAVLHPTFALWFKTPFGQFEGFVMPIRQT